MPLDNSKRTHAFLSLPLKTESDVILARRRSRQIALLAGFDVPNQTRLATAVSECARHIYGLRGDGRIEFVLEEKIAGVTIRIFDNDTAHDGKTADTNDFKELESTRRLVDKLDFELEKNQKREIVLSKFLKDRSLPFSNAEIQQMTISLSKLVHENPLDELYEQNHELLGALAELEQKQILLDSAFQELKAKNISLASLNDEIVSLNRTLESRVAERTQELLQLNEELIDARDQAIQANELKVQFIGNISHEIRTPMTGVLGLSEMMVSESDPTEKDDLAQNILNCAKQLMSVVNQLLDFSNLEAGKSIFVDQPFKVEQVFGDAKDLIAQSATEKGLTVSSEIAVSASDWLVGDADALKRVLTNLASNAVKFTEKGTITFSAKAEKEYENKLFVRFTVSDTGIGIEKALQTSLFSAFVQADGSTTRKYGGMGLGLSICKSLVEKMGGAIGFESVPGYGSEFWVVLPYLARVQS